MTILNRRIFYQIKNDEYHVCIEEHGLTRTELVTKDVRVALQKMKSLRDSFLMEQDTSGEKLLLE